MAYSEMDYMNPSGKRCYAGQITIPSSASQADYSITDIGFAPSKIVIFQAISSGSATNGYGCLLYDKDAVSGKQQRHFMSGGSCGIDTLNFPYNNAAFSILNISASAVNIRVSSTFSGKTYYYFAVE